MTSENECHDGVRWRMSLEELVAGTEGRVVSQNEREFSGAGTDTRADLSGKIFVALKGDRFDAHDFLPDAVKAGASALLVHRLPEAAHALQDKVTIVQVDDTLSALQKLGNFWRHKMKARILGITGTNGKTTSKEFAAAVIGSKFNVQYSKGSFNNHWGVPISLLSIAPHHEAAVIEMGMNHPGELKELSHIVEPDAVVVTMVGRGHLEGVGSIEGAAKAKAEIYDCAPANAVRIFNLENEHTRRMYERWAKELPQEKVMTFASRSCPLPAGLPRPTVALEVVSATPEALHVRGEIAGVRGEVEVPVFGRHNVTNLMVAASLGLACAMTAEEVWEALPLCRTAWGRNQWVDLEGGAKALFDAYNANPESMGAAIDNFAGLNSRAPGGRKIAVLGEMRELGAHAPELHRELGVRAAQAGFDHICFVGPSGEAFAAGVKSTGFSKTLFVTNSYELNLASRMVPVLDRNDILLIKGSRGMQLEKVLAEFKPIGFDAKK